MERAKGRGGSLLVRSADRVTGRGNSPHAEELVGRRSRVVGGYVVRFGPDALAQGNECTAGGGTELDCEVVADAWADSNHRQGGGGIEEADGDARVSDVQVVVALGCGAKWEGGERRRSADEEDSSVRRVRGRCKAT